MVPWDSNVCAFSCDVYKAVIIISERATINPYVFGIRFDLNGVNIMPSASFELQIADYDVFAFLQAQPFSGKFNPLPTTVDGLVRRHVQVRGEMNGAGNLKHNPQRFFSATRLTQRPRSIICNTKVKPNRWTND